MQVPVRGTTSSEQMKYCISYEHEGTSTTYNPIANNLKEKKSAYLLLPEGNLCPEEEGWVSPLLPRGERVPRCCRLEDERSKTSCHGVREDWPERPCELCPLDLLLSARLVAAAGNLSRRCSGSTLLGGGGLGGGAAGGGRGGELSLDEG